MIAAAHHSQLALDQVAKGEGDAIEGWVAYGAALNEGRSLHPGDREFGRWVKENVLSQVAIAPLPDDQSAAMWAAAFPDQFDEARTAGNARTVRGIYAKWNEINAERAPAHRPTRLRSRLPRSVALLMNMTGRRSATK